MKRFEADGSQASSGDHAAANSLPTGTRIIADAANEGNGELEAINGTRFEARLIVVDPNTETRVRMVAIMPQDTMLLDHLSVGQYRVVFATGADWNRTKEEFDRDGRYWLFGKLVTFEEVSDFRALHYDHYSITLHPVPSGNAHATPLSTAQFHALAGRR